MARSAVEIAEILRQRLADTDWTGFTEHFANDALFEYPFGFPGAPPEIRGRAAILEHLVESRKHIRTMIEVTDIASTVHETADPGVVVIETQVSGINKASGKAFTFASGVGVITVRDGEITRYRDYTNTVGAAAAVGRDVLAAQGGQS